MSIEFKLPNLGEGVESADIAEILVSPGDTVTAEQIIMELETEKAVVELPIDVAGAIDELLVAEGDSVEVGQTLLMISPSNAPSSNGQDQTSAASAAPSDAATPVSSAIQAQPDPVQEPMESAPIAHNSDAQEIEFVLPNIGEGLDSADVAEVHVTEGDEIDAEQIVMDLETEKAVVELPCSQAGTVMKVHVAAGETVAVGQVLLTLKSSVAQTVKSPDPQPSATSASNSSPKQASTESATTTLTTTRANRVQTPELVDHQGNGRGPVPAAPSTRRLARQLGVNLHQVDGSGPGGRITQDDVQAFVRQRLKGSPSSDSAGGGLTTLAPGSLAPPPLPDFSRFGQVDREKLSKIGRTAAENLTVSWNVIPHVTQHDLADVTELEAARKKFTKGIGSDGPKVTMTAIVMKALATCLQQYPKFNSSLDPETQEIVYKRYYHIGCAVDTPNGLLVPVVKDCDQKSIRDVAGEVGEMALLARDRKLPIDAMQGATCTVTNLGGIGGVAFTPIVNYPEVCILGLSRGRKELQIVDGEISERMMLPLALSYDHRVINGADAARFVASLCNMLSDPFQLLSAI
ncbi:MAG: 2-oxo acid dehydrogenase subunit E2 [Planctomycetaceae bacterium]|nr:2-oxo acid dehydrogenase subunit E2 [Planctomycetaceae bacterium]